MGPGSSRWPPSFHQTVAGLTSARTCRTSEGWHTRGRLKGDRRRAGVYRMRGSRRRMLRGRAIGRNTAAGWVRRDGSPWGNSRPQGSGWPPRLARHSWLVPGSLPRRARRALRERDERAGHDRTRLLDGTESDGCNVRPAGIEDLVAGTQASGRSGHEVCGECQEG